MSDSPATTQQAAVNEQQTPLRKARWYRRLIKNHLFKNRRNSLISILVIAIVLGTPGVSIAKTLTAPGNDPVSARLAEWARDHGLGTVVTLMEQIQYQLNPPKVGGSVAISAGTPSPAPSQAGVSLQPALKSLVSPAIANEGVYEPEVNNAAGEPIIQRAQIRPDSIHTSYLASVVWMSGAKVRFQLHPGYGDPGRYLSLWGASDKVSNNAATNLIATFNSGFRLKDSRGGYYQNGNTRLPLVNGAATFVTYKDGTSDIGIWGRDFVMSPKISSARQNLKLLIDNGKMAANINSVVMSAWGATLGSKNYVWRSGIGVTAAGDFVYVCGNALSAATLAKLLKNAGAVRAMQLDINPQWISYMWYLPNASGTLSPFKAALFDRPANRYFTESSRDFYAVYAK